MNGLPPLHTTGMPAMDATTLATLASILQGQKDAPLRLGSNIVARNPDVEIAALTLKEIPLTAQISSK